MEGETIIAYFNCGWFCREATFYRHALKVQPGDKSIVSSLLLLRLHATFSIVFY